MRIINFVDLLFSNEGSYAQDVYNFSFLKGKYELHYHVIGKISSINKKLVNDFIIHEYNFPKIIGYVKVFMNLMREDKDNTLNIILSTKYLYLFLLSILFNFYNYVLLVHFLPLTRRRLHVLILNFLIKRCKGFLVLEDFVKKDLIDNGVVNLYNKIRIIRLRDIENKEVKTKEDRKKLIVSFIGKISPYNDVSLLLELISSKKFDNIEFWFYSKGIGEYLKKNFVDVAKLKKLNDVKIEDNYLDYEEYMNLFRKSDFIFLNYHNYGVRFSSVVFNALSSGCQLIANDIPTFRYYVYKFNCGYIFEDMNKLEYILSNLKKKKINPLLFQIYSYNNRKKITEKIIASFFSDKLS